MKKIFCGLFFVAALAAEPAQRLVTVGGMASELVCELGHCADIVAVDITSVYPHELLQKPKVGYVSKLSAEGILSMKPTSLVFVDGAGPAEVLAQLEKSGVKLIKINKDMGIDAGVDRIIVLGKFLHANEKAQKLATKVKESLAALTKEKPKKKAKILFLYARGAQTLLAMGKNTTADEFITLSGAENAFSADGYKPVNAEAVAASQADIIMIPEGSLKGLGGREALKGIPGISQTPAGKNLRVVTIEDSLIAGIGPRTAKGVREMRKKISKELQGNK